MGRYAQRRRHASGPNPPPRPISIVEVDRSGLHSVDVLFDGPAPFVADFSSPHFLANGNAPSSGFNADATTISLVFAGLVGPVGTAWALSASPSWTSATVTAPAAGVTG